MTGPIERYLAELARALRRSPTRERTLDEVREHLEDSAAAARVLGLGAEAAEADAVARMGPVRTLTGRRRGRAPLALAVLVAAGVVGGIAVARSSGPTNLVALAPAVHLQHAGATPVLSGLGAMRIVSLDPATLAPQGVGVPLRTSNRVGGTVYLGGRPPEVAFGSPDGQHLGFVYDGAVQLMALRPLHRTGSIRFVPAAPTYGPTRWDQKGGSLDRVRAAAWLTGDLIALLVQHQSPPYASTVTARTLVVLDVATRRITRIPVALRGTIAGFAAGGDRLVALGCLHGTTSLLSADVSTLRARETPLAGVPCTRTPPAVAVRADGASAAAVGSDLAPVVVDLTSLHVDRMRKIAPGTIVDGTVAVRFTARGTVAVTGARRSKRGRRDVERGIGVELVDPAHPRDPARRLTATGSRLLVTGDSIVVSGYTGTGAGSGLTAFTSTGRRLWHADGSRLVRPFESGQRVYAPRSVERHTIVDAYDLGTGRQLARLFQRADGVRPITGAVDSTG